MANLDKGNEIHIKYNININQLATLISGIIKEVDLVDMAIFDFLWNYKNTSHSDKMQSNDYQWFSVHWSLIVKQNPLIKIKSRVGIYKRLKNLQNAKLLIPHEDNGGGGKAWYRFSKKADKLVFVSENELLEFQCRKDLQLLGITFEEYINLSQAEIEKRKEEIESTCKQPLTPPVNDCKQPPVNNGKQYNNTSCNNTCNNVYLSEQKIESSFDMASAINKLPLNGDNIESRISIWNLVSQHLKENWIVNQWEFMAGKKCPSKMEDVLKTWITLGEFHTVKEFKIHKIKNWITIAQKDSIKDQMGSYATQGQKSSDPMNNYSYQ